MSLDIPPPPTELLRVSDLHAFYGESHILHGVDFTVNRGELVTLLGRNGSGRTTTLKAILGLTGRRTGSVMVNGRETIAMPRHQIVKLGLESVVSEPCFRVQVAHGHVRWLIEKNVDFIFQEKSRRNRRRRIHRL